MTTDFVALCRRRPEESHTITALRAVGPELSIGAVGPLLQIRDEANHPLVTVEGPLLVQAPGEPLRLLGIHVDVPVWWVEARAETDNPRAALVAWQFVTKLAEQTEGQSWP